MKDAPQHTETEQSHAGAAGWQPAAEPALPVWQGALLRIQRSAGNRSTLRFVQAAQSIRLQRKCACEEEDHPCAECAAEKEKLQRATNAGVASPAASGSAEAPPIVHEVLHSQGRPLDAGTRSFMEPRFGHDFSGVRVHSDSRAAESARAVNALAYTVGNNVVFGAGQYAPGREGGQRLLAHELAHVVQQSAGGVSIQSKLAVGATGDAAELEAEAVANSIMEHGSGQGTPWRLTPGAPTLRRVYTTPQGIRESRQATETLPDGGSRTITRRIAICPCRRVDETRDAFYYNPDIDELALAYRRCTGSRTWTFFGRYDSNASQSLQIPALPQGTGRAGGSLSMRGDRASGRVDLYGLGANDQPGGAAGGGATVTIETRGWAFTASGEYRRLLDPAPGTARDQAQMSGRICPPGWPFCIGAQGTIGDSQLGNSVQGTISSRDDVPAIHETCSQCVCPRRPTYECQEDHPHRESRSREFRYYYALDRSDRPTEEPYLQAANQRNFEEIAALVRRGYSITSIEGYASPEATVSHNQPLSENRAGSTAQLLRAYLDSQGLQSAVVPAQTATGRGELLGSRPRPTRSSQLSEIVTDAGILPAELETLLLSGSVIENRDLEAQFRGLFSDPRMTPDLRMELFGLEASDPARPEVQAAVDDFIRARPGSRRRPWERIFRLFRYGAIFMEGSEVTGTDHNTPNASECNSYARQAERRNDFGPIDHAALQAETRSMDDTTVCDTESGTADQNCRYVAAPSTLSPTAPEVAPQQIP